MCFFLLHFPRSITDIKYLLYCITSKHRQFEPDLFSSINLLTFRIYSNLHEHTRTINMYIYKIPFLYRTFISTLSVSNWYYYECIIGPFHFKLPKIVLSVGRSHLIRVHFRVLNIYFRSLFYILDPIFRMQWIFEHLFYKQICMAMYPPYFIHIYFVYNIEKSSMYGSRGSNIIFYNDDFIFIT